MRHRPILFATCALVIAAGLASLASVWAVHAIERRTVAAVKSRLVEGGAHWASVSADGLRLRLTGTAPNEAQRFRALNLAGSVVDADRVRDVMEVAALRAPEAPAFSVEILRNEDGLSLIGLLPGQDEAARDFATRAGTAVDGLRVSDMLETADWPAPEGWQPALDFGVAALKLLPRSKVSIAPGRVAVTAISDSVADKQRLEAQLRRIAPRGVALVMDISAPRPVLTPFTLRLVKDDGGVRFDACSADTERARDRILAAGQRAGITTAQACTVGLGVPTPRWADAVVAGVSAVAAMPSGTVTFSDADVTLIAGPETPQALFDRTVGELQAALPDLFSLTATLTPRETASPAGPAEFTAALSAEGRVELRGRLTDALSRDAADRFAKARFGSESVYTAARLDPDLPMGWSVRVLTGLESLSLLQTGRLVVRADLVEVVGVTGRQDARARITQLLSDRLGPGQRFSVSVRYDEAMDPELGIPTPEECVGNLNAVLAAKKIPFAPGSAEISGDGLMVVDRLAEVARDCPPLAVEIGGHTDSQGSEAGNATLSQKRADSVLLALTARRVKTGGFVAKGYGEARPVADNATEEGRETNRRIEFALLGQPAATAEAAPAEPRSEPVPAPAATGRPDGTSVSIATAGAPHTAPAAAGEPIVVATAPVDPVNGATRSIVLDFAEGADATPLAGDAQPEGPTPAFAPTDVDYPRPLRRPADL